MALMHPGRMPPPPLPLTTLLLLLVLPLLSFSSFSSTLDEVKESLLEREGLRSLASFLSFDPEDAEDTEEAAMSMSSSRYIETIEYIWLSLTTYHLYRKPPKPIQKASSSLAENHGSVIGELSVIRPKITSNIYVCSKKATP